MPLVVRVRLEEMERARPPIKDFGAPRLVPPIVGPQPRVDGRAAAAKVKEVIKVTEFTKVIKTAKATEVIEVIKVTKITKMNFGLF